MKFKHIILITLLLLTVLTISAVSAADNQTNDIISADDNEIILDEAINDDVSNANDNYDDEITLQDSNTDDFIGNANDKTPLKEGTTGSFTDLNYLINTQYVSNDTITLSSNYKFSDDDGAFVHGITINRGVTIDGNGCTIDGSHKARIFNIDNVGTVKFLNINFINGKATGSTVNREVHGGAIYADYKNCVVENCNFTNNTASHMGGALGWVNAYNCVFTGNQAGNNGGAIYVGNAYNCTFTKNQAGNDGGAIDWGDAYNCVFTGNYANDGGAIEGGDAYNCTFTKNQAENGGGAMYGDQDYPESYTATLCIFDSNTPNDYAYIAIVDVALSADNLTTSYNSGDKLLFNLTADNTNYDGFNTTIKIYQNEQLVGTYYALSGDGWVVDLNPGTYKAVLSLDKYAGVSDETVTITVTGGTNPSKPDTNTSQTTTTKTDNVKLTLKTVKVKKSAKKLVLKATLKINGKNVKGKVVKFKFNGKTYKAKTNKKGIAKVTIKKNVLKKLKVGKKVKYQASYGSTIVKKTAKIKK